MKKYIRYIFYFLIAFALISSCKKKTPDDIGLPFVPSNDLLKANFTDTFTIISHTMSVDTIPTNFPTPMLLGSYNDPIFGPASASIYVQYEPQNYLPSFGGDLAHLSLDSVVLSLPYYLNQKYGSLISSADGQKFKVYAITQQFYYDSVYYSSRNMSVGTELASSYLLPDMKDSIFVPPVGTAKLPPQLRIQLNVNYFKQFLDSLNPCYTDISTFQNAFKGINISSLPILASGNGAILYIDIANTLYSHITLYYKNPKTLLEWGTARDTFFNFNVTSNCARFSHFYHDYSSVVDIQHQLHTDSTNATGQTDVYVQPMAGLKTKIYFPYLKSFFNDGKKAINQAVLILKVDPNSILLGDTVYYPHPQLTAMVADSAIYNLPDYAEGLAYFGGVYDATNKQYAFNISRYIQQILSGKISDKGICIIATSRQTTANRAQLIGGNKSIAGHMRLKVTYTPLSAARKKPNNPSSPQHSLNKTD